MDYTTQPPWRPGDGSEAVILSERLGRALRQIERCSATAEAHENEASDDLDEFFDQAYFTLLAVRQAVAARDFLEAAGLDPPPIRNAGHWVSRRDMEEHWRDHLGGKVVRAKAKWDKSDHALLTRALTYDANSIANLPLHDLREDLAAVQRAASEALRPFLAR
jgi:hypothetical protein